MFKMKKKRCQISLFHTASEDLQEFLFKLLEHITVAPMTVLDLRTSFPSHGWDYVLQRFRQEARGEERGKIVSTQINDKIVTSSFSNYTDSV